MAKKETTFVAPEGAKRLRARDALVNGMEVPSSIPMAPPVGYTRQPTLAERIRQMVRSEHVRLAAIQAGQETFEEADDFDVGDDYDPASPYEETFDPIDAEARMRLREEDYRVKLEARLQELQPVKEKDDGPSSVDEGRRADPDSKSGHSDPKPKGKSGEVKASSDE